jgi:glutamyl-tRNA synthetase
LVLRNEDLDANRARPEFVAAMYEDLRWLGIEWQEGPDCGGPFAPYSQSQRLGQYKRAFDELRNGGFLYPCCCSRKDIRNAAGAPHPEDDEVPYPGTCRGRAGDLIRSGPGHSAWRFRVPDGERISFLDHCQGFQQFEAGKDFGDFVVWRADAAPSYQLAVVVDDAAMRITEVVRGADLLVSTARQLLLYRALDLAPPSFFHCPLVVDRFGSRLAKRNDALSLRSLRKLGFQADEILNARFQHLDVTP